jgi:Tfp pilus assembly protein FimT
VTLAIAAILAAVAAPSMSTMLVGNRIRTSGTDLMSSLLLARSEAIKRKRSSGRAADVGQLVAGLDRRCRGKRRAIRTRRTASARTSR